jgi:hypothetical protein
VRFACWFFAKNQQEDRHTAVCIKIDDARTATLAAAGGSEAQLIETTTKRHTTGGVSRHDIDERRPLFRCHDGLSASDEGSSLDDGERRDFHRMNIRQGRMARKKYTPGAYGAQDVCDRAGGAKAVRIQFPRSRKGRTLQAAGQVPLPQQSP